MNTILRLIRYAKDYKGLMFITVLSTILYSLLNLVTPSLLRNLINIISSGQANESLSSIYGIALILTGTYLVRGVFQFVKNYIGHKAAWNLTGKVRVMLFKHMETLSMKFYHDKQTGQLMSRVVNDTSNFELMIAHAIPDLISNGIIFIGVAVMLILINPMLTLMTLIPIPFLVFSGWFFVKKIRPEFRAAHALIGDLNAHLQDSLSGMREIQIFNQQEYEEQNIFALTFAHIKKTLAALKKSAVFHPFVEFFTSFGTVIVVVFGGYMAARQNMPLADIVAFLLYLSLFYQPIATFARLLEDMQQAQAGAERVFAILDTQPDITDSPTAKTLGRVKGDIDFQNVSFSYTDERPIIKDLSFSVKSGQMLALVGPTGVGKTTIANLIARFYDPVSGEIKIDGEDIKNITLESLRSQISMVLQDVFLFNGTVLENIAYGNKDATIDQIRQAAKIACADEFIQNMSEGYDTVIGERGVKLSGGQKQRLSIARAVLCNSPILIMDEATASVDTETETHIRQAIDSLMGTRTMIVIAHRLSTVRQADCILVLEDGQIKEKGTHNELLKKDGLYARLCQMQLSE